VAVGGVVTTNFWLVLAGLIGMQIVASLFGPVRGSLIPDLVSKDDVPTANGWIEAGTLIAMIIGVWLVGVAFSYDEFIRSVVTCAVMCVSVAVFLVVNFIPDVPRSHLAKKTDWNIFRSTINVLKIAVTDVGVRGSVFLIAWGWFLSSLVLSTAPAIVKRVGGDPQTISFAMMILGVSGAIGAQVAGRLSKTLPFGVSVSSGFCGLGFSIVALGAIALKGFPISPIWVTAGFMGLASYSFSFVLIPLASRIQLLSAPENRAKTIAGSGGLCALSMVTGGYLVAALQAGSIDLSAIYLTVGLVTVFLPLIARAALETRPATSQV
jgi:acyl-[acyl-carrier-protein]-phospholipid O-acyltransferase / long-chain-fatty-acid--[acyl-carrier-protein] ligase